ncbi:MAG: nucleoside 2-deoxyribosyltransferase [Acidobacteriota bacterium]|nr:nucleoside 2-deoxyribosyltransferase [Acidobacteriota bacterium]
MNIYLACTVRGDRGAVAVLRQVADHLETAGHTVLTRHLLDDHVDSAESALTEREVFARDLQWLTAADVLIADASGSSYGVGFEVGYVLGKSDQTDQGVLLLYSDSRRSVVSRLIVGTDHPRCTVHSYDQAADLLPVINRFLAQQGNEP